MILFAASDPAQAGLFELFEGQSLDISEAIETDPIEEAADGALEVLIKPEEKHEVINPYLVDEVKESDTEDDSDPVKNEENKEAKTYYLMVLKLNQNV
mgnify:CR=1 FL=1